jgi:16S rRNA (guanine966-N2)-methyltransferase
MRVISGSARGRRLKEPGDYSIRPTTDKVKESVFNIIQFDIEGRRVLDLFAGTGQMGIEALSRGGATATFVDQSRQAVLLVQENLKICGLSNGKVVQGDSIAFLTGCERHDIIFLDPPYGKGLLESALKKIIEFDILKENGIIICESKAETILPVVTEPYRMLKEYKYGKIKLTLFTRTSN